MSHRSIAGALVLAVAWGSQALLAQAPAPQVTQEEVNEAIRKGAEFLKRRPNFSDGNRRAELIVFTLLHAGVPVNDPQLAQGIEYIRSIDVGQLDAFEDKKTYRVAIAALALGSVGAEKDRLKMAQFAYYLVANQCGNGQWSYGANAPLPKELLVPEDGVVVTDPNGGTPVPEGEKKPIPIGCPRRLGPATGDNSNTQFALLGLRACADAGSGIPEKTWMDALKVMQEAQQGDGSWGYYAKRANTGKGAPPPDPGYGSMTASGVCDVVICMHFLKKKWETDRHVKNGLAWLGKHFTVTENAKAGAVDPGSFADSFHYYYLYALERAGQLASTEKLGDHAWYQEGARYLVDHQAGDGSWKDEKEDMGNMIEDTCFAILFLGRATPPFKATEAAGHR